MKLFLGPGELVANVFGLPDKSEHRMIFRSFFNTLFWGLVGVMLVAVIAI